MDRTNPPANPANPTGPTDPTATATMPEVFGPAGLEGVMNQLRAAGYGGHVDSWLSTGGNQAITAQALQGALRPETVQQISAASGMTPDAVHQMLTTTLPAMISFWSPMGAWAPFSSGNRMQELAQLGVLLGGMFAGAHAGSMPNWQAMLRGMGMPPMAIPGQALGGSPATPAGPRTISSDLGTITLPGTDVKD
jgi:uncharacterized protein YidB (DUF937 family)